MGDFQRAIQRLRLQPMKLAETSYPNRYRASLLAGRYWCDERMRIEVVHGVRSGETVRTMEGTENHERLFNTLGKRHPWEEEFIQAIEPYRVSELGFVRQHGGAEIYDNLTGHPDDFQVSPGKEVSVVEYKTTANKSPWYLRFVMATAKVQAGILYPYIMEPTIFKLGYEIAKWHAVAIYSRDLELLQWRSFEYDPVATEIFLDECMEIFDGKRETIAPKPFKCSICKKRDPQFQEYCRFCQEEKK